MDFLELRNYFSKDKYVEYVHGPWTGSTTCGSRSTAWGSNLDRWFHDEGLRLDQPKGYTLLKSGP
jgi:hypothetical protein